MFTRFLIKYVFRYDLELRIPHGSVFQKGSIYAVVDTMSIWKQETTSNKIRSLFKLKWNPSNLLLLEAKKQALMNFGFGNELNYGDQLLKISEWHHSIEWNLDKLTESDLEKAKGLQTLSVLVQTVHRNTTSPHLHLNLTQNAYQMCILLHPMVVKIPVNSIFYYIDIHSEFAFNEIRKADYPNADDLISYIYELQYIQQKIALSLHELIHLISEVDTNKGDSMLIKAEVSAISESEAIINYLKASIEKIIVIIGLTYEIKNLEAKKSHKQKLDALKTGVPERVKELFYSKLIFDFISSESIQTLNNYRTGILHKKGISDLQPHKYVGVDSPAAPLIKTFNFLMNQHKKNTSVIIGAYALLTDELVYKVPPSISPEELPLPSPSKELSL